MLKNKNLSSIKTNICTRINEIIFRFPKIIVKKLEIITKIVYIFFSGITLLIPFIFIYNRDKNLQNENILFIE